MPAAKLTIPVPLRTRAERRSAERVVAAMPVAVNGDPGTTQDLSAGGLCFVAERPYEIGERVEVVIEYLLDGHNYPLQCEAEVVRVQHCDEGYEIGARLAPQAPATEPPAPPLRTVR